MVTKFTYVKYEVMISIQEQANNVLLSNVMYTHMIKYGKRNKGNNDSFFSVKGKKHFVKAII